MLRKALIVIDLDLDNPGLTATSVLFFAFTAARAVLFLAEERHVLKLLAATMMRNAEAANIGSEQAHQDYCDKSFHYGEMKSRKIALNPTNTPKSINVQTILQ